MFKIKFKSLNKKIGVLLSIVLLLTFTIVLTYYNFSLKSRINFESEQLLLKIGNQYEKLLSGEINKMQSISEILSLNISKNIDNEDFTEEIAGTFKNIIYNNDKIYNISLVTTKSKELPDSLIIKELDTDSVYFYSISFSKTTDGIVKDKKLIQFRELNNQLLFTNAIENEVNKVLNPEFINDEKLGLIPIIKPIYRGNRYIGYLRIFISTSWLTDVYVENALKDNLEIMIISDNGKILFLKKKQYLLGKSLKTEFSEYVKLTKISDYEYQSLFKNNLLTLCKSINFDQSKSDWSVCLSVEKQYLYKSLNFNFWIHLSVGLILLILTIWILIYIVDYNIKPLKDVIDFAKNVSVGNFELDQKKYKSNREDEIGQLNKAFISISMFLKEVADVSKSIALGDFSKNINLRSEKDILANSLNQMSNSLKNAKQTEKIRIEEDEYSRWFSKGTNEINNVLKVHHKNIQELAENVSHKIVKFFNFALCGIFLMYENEDEGKYLELISAYAYSDSKFIKRKFKLGQSLVGSSASEKRLIYLSKLPRGYLDILSGLGKSSPKSLLIVPLVYEDEVLGVIEIASLNEISKKEIELIENIAESIANSLSSARTNITTQELLEKSQRYTEELALKDESMNATVVQLQELQEKTAKSEATVRTKLNAMNNTLLTVEYTVDGILLDANQKYLSTMNYSFEEIKGINVFELLHDEDRIELLRVIEIVKKGNFYESIMHRHTKEGREKWLLATYTPLKNEEGEVEKILFYATDITTIKQN
ncbi:MAG: GAF domain-containing protein [Bacteroidales bacterium]|nr:GAF domain-containing protein [Bacteroidales bacterium]MBN2755783.1 GAF domain-containing protein [Bacteroidales bacterium]